MIYTVENAPKGIEVFLDGEKQDTSEIFMADPDGGVIHRYLQPIRLVEGKNEIAWEEVRGVVTVRLPDGQR